MYEKTCKHVKQYLNNVEYIEQVRRARLIEEKQQRIDKEHDKKRKEAIVVPEIQRDFMSQFADGCFPWRTKFLVLDGPSKLGKSVYAESLASYL
jgi:adenosyl cobinamide kinase/adenosyl cobinamide phosphate guanylyltransferase